MTCSFSIVDGQCADVFEKVYSVAYRHYDKRLRIGRLYKPISTLNSRIDMIEYYINLILSKYNAKFTFESGILEFKSQDDATEFLLRWS